MTVYVYQGDMAPDVIENAKRCTVENDVLLVEQERILHNYPLRHVTYWKVKT